MNRSLPYRVLLVALTLSLSACASRGIQPMGVSLSQPRAITVARPTQVQLPALPNSYRGQFPCADCAGLETQLDLLPDGRFWLHETNMSTLQTRHDAGLWQITGNQLWLYGQQNNPIIFYALTDGGWLKSGIDGLPHDTRGDFELVEMGWRPKNSSLVSHGMLRYVAGEAYLTDCRSGVDYPVQQDDTWTTLRERYLRDRLGPVSAVLVSGEVAYQWQVTDEGAVPSVRIVEVDALNANSTCGRAAENVQSSSWSLAHLSGIWDVDLENVVRPKIEIQQSRFSGNGGCNAIAGEIAVEDYNVTVGPVASTRRMCASGMEIESAFLSVLENVAYASKEGRLWVWYDVNMTRLAAFVRTQ